MKSDYAQNDDDTRDYAHIDDVMIGGYTPYTTDDDAIHEEYTQNDDDPHHEYDNRREYYAAEHFANDGVNEHAEEHWDISLALPDVGLHYGNDAWNDPNNASSYNDVIYPMTYTNYNIPADCYQANNYNVNSSTYTNTMHETEADSTDWWGKYGEQHTHFPDIQRGATSFHNTYLITSEILPVYEELNGRTLEQNKPTYSDEVNYTTYDELCTNNDGLQVSPYELSTQDRLPSFNTLNNDVSAKDSLNASNNTISDPLPTTSFDQFMINTNPSSKETLPTYNTLINNLQMLPQIECITQTECDNVMSPSIEFLNDYNSRTDEILQHPSPNNDHALDNPKHTVVKIEPKNEHKSSCRRKSTRITKQKENGIKKEHLGMRKKRNTKSGSKLTKVVKQRRSANVRERRRMRSINDAFEKLRDVIPNVDCAERRMSKMDTLTVAMSYISYLKNIMELAGGQKSGTTKVTVTSHVTVYMDDTTGYETTFMDYALSCEQDNPPNQIAEKRYKAKIWEPQEDFQILFSNLCQEVTS